MTSTLTPSTRGGRPESARPRPDVHTGAAAPARAHALQARWSARPMRERVAVLGLLLATLGLYLYGLTANGYANSFYSAAVQAGSESWTALFYGSSDAANSITVDKPPASLWVMSLSVRLFGLSPSSILVPEVLMGVATVGVLYSTVRRHFGHAAGLLAGAVMASTPVAVLMFRYNNPDALLVLLLTLATWATLRATEQASGRLLALAGVFVGLAFLTKSLQAFLVLPALALVYLLAAPTTLRHRILHGLLAVAAVVVSGGWWVAIVELVPTSLRPYIGGSQTNSFLELTFGYNGLGRINGDEAGAVGPNSGTQSLLRLFSGSVGGQISWLLPSALVLLAAGLWMTRRATRTDPRRAAYLAWGGWLVVSGLVFSLMAGIFHEYYTVALAPAIAALVGMGAAHAWERRDDASLAGPAVLATATATAATWSFILLTRVADSSYGLLRVVVLAVGMAAALLLLAIGRVHRHAVPMVVAAALAAGLAGPLAYSASTVSSGYTGSIVTAGPSVGWSRGGPQGSPPIGGGGPMGGLLDASQASSDVVAALATDADSYTWVAAAVGSQNAAGLQLSSGLPVMAIGGFNGSDPSPTLAEFQQYVADGAIHYLLASQAGPGGGPGGDGLGGGGTAGQITTWAAASFATVTIDGTTFYDLTRPLTDAGGAASTTADATTSAPDENA